MKFLYLYLIFKGCYSNSTLGAIECQNGFNIENCANLKKLYANFGNCSVSIHLIFAFLTISNQH